MIAAALLANRENTVRQMVWTVNQPSLVTLDTIAPVALTIKNRTVSVHAFVPLATTAHPKWSHQYHAQSVSIVRWLVAKSWAIATAVHQAAFVTKRDALKMVRFAKRDLFVMLMAVAVTDVVDAMSAADRLAFDKAGVVSL